jgi:type II secretory pathway pseudopilin PulG
MVKIMKNIKLLLLNHYLKKIGNAHKKSPGYTMVELMGVMFILAIIAAMLAPSWLGFTNRQRLGKANEAVLNAIRETQNLAKTAKRNYTLNIRQTKVSNANTQLPEIAIYRSDDPPTTLPWKKLGSDLGLNQGQISVCSNLSTTSTDINKVYNTTATTTGTTDTVCNLTNPITIRFNYLGNLAPAPTLGTGVNSELKISVIIVPNSSTLPSNTAQKCVAISTLLGSTRIDEGSYNSTTGKGCQ